MNLVAYTLLYSIPFIVTTKCPQTKRAPFLIAAYPAPLPKRSTAGYGKDRP